MKEALASPKDAALKLALEYIETNAHERKYVRHAIKAALAQPEKEPLEYWNVVEGWVKIDEVLEHFDSVGCGTIYKTAGEGREPLYTTPPQRTWVGLTDDEQQHAYEQWQNDGWGVFYNAIEAKLKEKNNG